MLLGRYFIDVVNIHSQLTKIFPNNVGGSHTISWKTLREKLRFPRGRRNSAVRLTIMGPTQPQLPHESFQPAGLPYTHQTRQPPQPHKPILIGSVSLENLDLYRLWAGLLGSKLGSTISLAGWFLYLRCFICKVGIMTVPYLTHRN